jgi:riboflavin kinase/FMN adenylyltransferase
MHLAHQQLFDRLDEHGGIIVIQSMYANLSPFTHRQKHTKFPIYVYPLENIKHLNGKQFVHLIKEEFPKLQKIVVGFDFHFGHLAAYDNANLTELFDGTVEIVEEFKIDNVAVHSRVIRSYLRDGNIEFANKLLGYNYNLTGFAVKGQGLGKKQFVPTINIDVKDFLLPQEGIYITRTKLNDSLYDSVTFVGHRGTTDGKFAMETHILNKNFNQEIPKNIQVEFIKKLRDNQKFDKFEELKKQIDTDIEIVSTYFEEKNEKCN